MGAGASSTSASVKRTVENIEGMKDAIRASKSSHQAFKAPELDDTSAFMLSCVPSEEDCCIMYTISNGKGQNYSALRTQREVVSDKELLYKNLVESIPSNEKQKWSTFFTNLSTAIKNKTFFVKVTSIETGEIVLYVRVQQPSASSLATIAIPLKKSELTTAGAFDLMMKLFGSADYSLKEKDRNNERQRLDALTLENKMKELQAKVDEAEALKEKAVKEAIEKLNKENEHLRAQNHTLGVKVHTLEELHAERSEGTSPADSTPKKNQLFNAFATKKDNNKQITFQSGEGQSFDLPVQRVMDILKNWRDAFIKEDQDVRNLDYILSVIENDELYQADVHAIVDKEIDSDVREWLQNEMLPAAAVRRWNKLKAFARAIKFTSILKPIPFEVSDHIPQPVLDLMHNIDDLDWDVFEVMKVSEGRGLYYTAVYLFHKHNLINKFQIPVQKMLDFFDAVDKGYKNNPYHNAIHGCDVMQTVNHFIVKGGYMQHLTEVDIMAAIVAAASHDIGHPGVSNLFERLIESERALLYNDQSILENFHCASTFKLLQDPMLNITENMTKDDRRAFRDMVINMILATDIGRHFAILDVVRRGILKKFDPSNKEDLSNYMKMVVKCADVGNPAKRLNISQQWSFRVQEEFFLQGDEEKRLGLPVSPFMDRDKPNLPKSQIGFIDYIAKPLFECLVTFDPKLDQCMQNMIVVRSHWDSQQLQQ